MDLFSLRTLSSLIAARNALGWTQADFAARSKRSLVTVARIEAGSASPRLSTISVLREALSGAGVRIIDDAPPGGFTIFVERRALETNGNAAVSQDNEIEPGFIAAIVAARHALGWTQAGLSERSKIGLNTIAQIEAGLMRPTKGTLSSLRKAVESRGVAITFGSPSRGLTLEAHPTAVREFRARKFPTARSRRTASPA